MRITSFAGGCIAALAVAWHLVVVCGASAAGAGSPGRDEHHKGAELKLHENRVATLPARPYKVTRSGWSKALSADIPADSCRNKTKEEENVEEEREREGGHSCSIVSCVFRARSNDPRPLPRRNC
ncbi:hypothetical protein MRX96_044515 [Rhipicephalus microplus]